MNRNQPAPNYTVIALDGLFQCKQKTHLDDLQPKWLAATVSRTRGCSFGPTRKGQQLTPHQRRLQDMRRTKTKKRSRFAWKKDSSAHVSPTPGSPFSSPNNSPTHSTRHIPFNSNSEKTCWFDQFSKPPEDEDPSSCIGKCLYTQSYQRSKNISTQHERGTQKYSSSFLTV